MNAKGFFSFIGVTAVGLLAISWWVSEVIRKAIDGILY
jgi:hypothetical protein